MIAPLSMAAAITQTQTPLPDWEQFPPFTADVTLPIVNGDGDVFVFGWRWGLVLTSADAGEGWRRLSSETPADVYTYNPRWIADPRAGGALYAVWDRPFHGQITYRLGFDEQWLDVPCGETLYFPVDEPGVVYCEGRRSDDNGRTWKFIGDLPDAVRKPDPSRLSWSGNQIFRGEVELSPLPADELVLGAVDLDAGEILAATATARLYRSADQGSTWHASEPGTLGPCRLDGFVATSFQGGAGPATRLLAFSETLRVSDDGGHTWRRSVVQGEGVPTVVNKLAVTDRRGHELLADSAYTADGGASWTTAGACLDQIGDFESTVVGHFASHPRNRQLVLAQRRLISTVIPLVSRDGGATWRALQRPTDGDLCTFVIDPDRVGGFYCFDGYNEGGIWQSSDFGESWQLLVETHKLAPPVPASSRLRKVSLTAAGQGLIWVLRQHGNVQRDDIYGVELLRSRDAGSTWETVATLDEILPLHSTRIELLPDLGSPNRVFLFGTEAVPDPAIPGRFTFARLFAVWDGDSDRLERFPVALEKYGWRSVVAQNPVDPGLIVVPRYVRAGGQASGYWTEDGGATWQALVPEPASEPDASVLALEWTDDGITLFAGTTQGLFRARFGESPEPCVPDGQTLCLLDGRFRVTAEWAVGERDSVPSRSGAGRRISLTQDTGAFWFFEASNVELLVKVLNGCGVNGRRWVFAGGLTNVQVDLSVTDTETGAVWLSRSEEGKAFQPVLATDAFLCAPHELPPPR